MNKMHIGVVAIASMLAISCAAQSTPKEAQDLAAYPLTMDHVTRQYQTLMDLTRQEQQDPGLRRDLQGWSKLPLDRQIQLFETNPKTAALAKAHGITARDQVMTQSALTAVVLAYPSIEAGKGPNAYNKLEFDASSGDHAKFFREHQAEIMKLGQQLVDVVIQPKK